MSDQNNVNEETLNIDQFQAHWEWTDANGVLHTEPFLMPDYDGDLERYIEKYVAPDIELDFPVDETLWYANVVTTSNPLAIDPSAVTTCLKIEHRELESNDLKYQEVETSCERAPREITPIVQPQPSPPPRLNVLFFPNRAIQFAHIVAIFDNPDIQVGQKMTLKTNVTLIKDAWFLGIESSTDLRLYVATKRPLNGQITKDWNVPSGACVCVLVDWRFFFRGKFVEEGSMEEHERARDGYKWRPAWFQDDPDEDAYSLCVSHPNETRTNGVARILFSSDYFTKQDWINYFTFGFGSATNPWKKIMGEKSHSDSASEDIPDSDVFDRYYKFLGLYSSWGERIAIDTGQSYLFLVDLENKLLFKYGAYLYRWNPKAFRQFRRLYSGQGENAPLSPRYPARVVFPYVTHKSKSSDADYYQYFDSKYGRDSDELTIDERYDDVKYFEPKYWTNDFYLDWTQRNALETQIKIEETSKTIEELTESLDNLDMPHDAEWQRQREIIQAQIEQRQEDLVNYQDLASRIDAAMSRINDFIDNTPVPSFAINKDRSLSVTVVMNECVVYNGLELSREDSLVPDDNDVLNYRDKYYYHVLGFFENAPVKLGFKTTGFLHEPIHLLFAIEKARYVNACI